MKRSATSFKYFLKRILILAFSLFIYSNGKAQNFDMNVTINSDALPPEAKDRIKDLKQQIEDYYNKNKFYDNSLFNENNKPGEDLYKIKANIQINFRGTNGFDLYDAQILFLSQRIIDKSDKRENPRYTVMFKFLDEKCKFTYNRSMPFIKNDVRFDSFLSLLDYYAYIMLGYDQDSFFPKDHQKNRSLYFQKALDICNKPMQDRTGWTESGGGSKPTRIQIAQELMNVRFTDFRNAVYEYHWLGLDSLGLSKNAYVYIFNALEKIGNLKKKEVKAFNPDIFFDTKALEIADIFLNYGDKNIYDRLIQIDPAHQRIYEDAKKRAR